MKKLLLSLILVVAGCFAFAKPVTVEYYDGYTFETDTACIGKVCGKEYLMNTLMNTLELLSETNPAVITYIGLCDVDETLSDEETPEPYKAFIEEILRGPYSGVWIYGSSGVAEWFVTDTNEVYCVEYEWVEEE